MRFAALTNVRGSSQSVAIEAHVRTCIQARSPSLPVSKRSRRFPWRLVLFFPALCGALYFLTESNKTGSEGVPAASSVPAPLPAWVEIPIPEDVFRLETAEFAGGAYSARQHRTGGGRQDIFDFSGATEKESLLSLLIYQPGSEAVPDSSFFLELARRAAESGRGIIRAGQPVEITTKFGAFEAARLGLARDGAAVKDCLGFRFANGEPGLRISGFACGGEGLGSHGITPAALACIIDQIDLAPGAGDKGLVDFFAAHYSLRSPNCLEPGIDPLPPAQISKTGGTVPLKARKKSH
jgi:hypothetical protein